VTASQERLCSMEFITQSVSQSVSQFLSLLVQQISASCYSHFYGNTNDKINGVVTGICFSLNRPLLHHFKRDNYRLVSISLARWYVPWS